MRTVFLVDGHTRVILPASQWAFAVRESWSQKGRVVRATAEDPDSCVRNEDELARMGSLLEETGL